MENWPYTKEEWDEVFDVACDIASATYNENLTLQASLIAKLKELLTNLENKYGPHPALYETEADFEDDIHKRIKLYEKAISLSLSSHLQTASIRISLARVYIEDLNDPLSAEEQLNLCEKQQMDSDDQKEWEELKNEINRLTSH